MPHPVLDLSFKTDAGQTTTIRAYIQANNATASNPQLAKALAWNGKIASQLNSHGYLDTYDTAAAQTILQSAINDL